MASLSAHAKHAGDLESPAEYGMFDATRSLASVFCKLLRSCSRLADESLADTSPTSVLNGKSCTAHLRMASRKKFQDSCTQHVQSVVGIRRAEEEDEQQRGGGSAKDKTKTSRCEYTYVDGPQ